MPLAAMAAATMWALAGNEIVMGAHSQLGPIDPQLVTPQGSIPARAVIEQFERAKRECAQDASLLGAWLPILQQYGPALIEQCEAAEELARRLVRERLRNYIFQRQANAMQVARHFALKAEIAAARVAVQPAARDVEVVRGGGRVPVEPERLQHLIAVEAVPGRQREEFEERPGLAKQPSAVGNAPGAERHGQAAEEVHL